MIAACQRAHVLLLEAMMYRFHPRMRYLKQMLVAHELGDVRFLHAAFSFNFNAPGNYRAYKQFGGGALLEVVGTTAAISAPLAFTAWHNDPTILLIQRGTVFGQRQFVPSDPYKHMVEHFATCVLKKTPLLYPAEDGWANLHVLDILRGIENAL